MCRRIGYSLTYEAIAIICTTILLIILGNDPLQSFPLAVITSVLAILWNLVWNSIFEFFERKLVWRGRPVWVRVIHAIGFEGGLGLLCIPLLSLWLGIPLLEAFFTEIGLLVFFLIYTYIFNYSFDKIFGLPESAR